MPYWILLSVVLIVTMYITMMISSYKKQISNMSAMMIAMTVSMISSLYLGTILGVIGQNRMLEPTIMAIVYGMIIGYLLGKPFTILAILDGVMAGVMGGMMGAMLGVMVLNQSPFWVLLLLGIIFLFIMLLLYHWVKQKAAEQHSISEKYTWIFFLSLLLYMISFLVFSAESRTQLINWCRIPNSITNQVKEPEVKVEAKNGHQDIRIQVQATGYIPNQIKVKAGIPIHIHFINPDPQNCASHIIMEDFGIKQFLKKGETVIKLPAQSKGTYSFHCEMNMFFGKIIVEP
ncbi:cupredoxin domain-containing protein [Thermoflavimicrobium daqui]|uniref:cupredoxin domain-containing protein n=1 Tax=Thermoflavimicrobium daqui TaxID=2137476 RepID=UPI00143D23B2|nr:cupredoxin domain-containing protein [Thermoflavimicrobium daqui]